MSQKSRFRSILNLRCPRCRMGHLFEQPFSFKTAYRMPERCPVCQQNYEPEPGFYYGAMFISYIMTAWIFIIVGLGLAFGLGWSATATLLAVAALTVVIHNVVFRLSRAIWIHIFVKYDPNVASTYASTNAKE